MTAAFSLAAIALLAASARGDALPAPIAEGSDRSISCGAVNRGALFGGVALPERGPAHVVPEPWASRDQHHGTIELVGLIQRAAAAVSATHPGSVLGVADLRARSSSNLPASASTRTTCTSVSRAPPPTSRWGAASRRFVVARTSDDGPDRVRPRPDELWG